MKDMRVKIRTTTVITHIMCISSIHHKYQLKGEKYHTYEVMLYNVQCNEIVTADNKCIKKKHECIYKY